MDRDVKVVIGNNISFRVEFNELEEEASEAYFSCKKKLDDEDYIFQVTLNNGITLQEGTTTYVVNVPNTITKEIEKGNYYYDLTFVISGSVFTLLKGIITFEPTVTVI